MLLLHQEETQTLLGLDEVTKNTHLSRRNYPPYTLTYTHLIIIALCVKSPNLLIQQVDESFICSSKTQKEKKSLPVWARSTGARLPASISLTARLQHEEQPLVPPRGLSVSPARCARKTGVRGPAGGPWEALHGGPKIWRFDPTFI